MNQEMFQPLATTTISTPEVMEQYLRALGVVLVNRDDSGQPRLSAWQQSDWLTMLLSRPNLVRDAMTEADQAWSSAAERPVLVLDGLALIPLQWDGRRRRTGRRPIAVVATQSLCESGYLPALCQAAELDLTLAQTMLQSASLPHESEVDRLAGLIRCAHSAQQNAWQDRAAAETLGQQLAESYEEINLLYTITGSMTAVERPSRFISIVCEELLATLPYRWIAALMADDAEKLKRLSGRLTTVGAAPLPVALREHAAALFSSLEAGKSIVIDHRTSPEHPALRALGSPLIIQPLASDGHLIGMLIAGDKQGPDPDASSVDTKLLGASATHMAIFLENAALYDDLNTMFLGTLEALTASIDAKDRYTCGHSERVALLTQQLAAGVGLDEHTVGRMRIAGLVHDVGKIGVPERVLLKPGRLTEEEFAWIRRHPGIGHRILKDIPQLRDVLPGVLHHHERWDGAGYPSNLAGESIPLVGRLIALADSFDAMSSTRTYRSPMSRAEVLEEIARCAGSQFDPDLARVFVTLEFDEYDRLVREHSANDPIHGYEGEAA